MNTSVRRSSFLFALASVANISIGFAFQLVLARRLGLTDRADLWAIGTVVPTLAATVMVGSGPSVMVPVLTRLRVAGDVTSRRNLYFQVPRSVCLILASSVVASGVLLALAQPMDSALATMSFGLLTAVAIPLAWVVALSHAVLIERGKFLMVGLSGAINGMALLLVAALSFGASWGMAGLGAAFLSGYLAESVVMFLYASRHLDAGGQARPLVAADRNLLVLLGAALVYKSQPLVERILVADIPGGPAAFGYAAKLGQAVLIGSTLGMVLISLPSISRAVAEGNLAAGARLARKYSLAIAAFAAPLVGVGVVENDRVVDLVLGGGAFQTAEIDVVGDILAVALIGVYFSAICGPINNYQHAIQRSGRLAVVSLGAMGVGGCVSLALRPAYGLPGVAAGAVSAFVITYLILSTFLPDFAACQLFAPLLPLGIVIGFAAAADQFADRASLEGILRLGTIGTGAFLVSLVVYRMMSRAVFRVDLGTVGDHAVIESGNADERVGVR